MHSRQQKNRAFTPFCQTPIFIEKLRSPFLLIFGDLIPLYIRGEGLTMGTETLPWRGINIRGGLDTRGLMFTKNVQNLPNVLHRVRNIYEKTLEKKPKKVLLYHIKLWAKSLTLMVLYSRFIIGHISQNCKRVRTRCNEFTNCSFMHEVSFNPLDFFNMVQSKSGRCSLTCWSPM